jgi:heterodisulfide reductase subunit B
MEFAFFKGCKIPYYQPHYATATEAVLDSLGVKLVDLEFGCCGYPIRQQDQDAWLISAARNLAIAAAKGLDILTPCKCCFGSLKKAAYTLAHDEEALERVNTALFEEELKYEPGKIEVKHLLQVLDKDIGAQVIKEKIQKPFTNLNVATHYGCHALRPSKITEFDDPVNPTIFDRLVEITGAKSLDWDQKTQCCGNPQKDKNNPLAKAMTAKKLNSGLAIGADFVCVACTYCQIQFDTVQKEMLDQGELPQALPSLLYPQLLGVSMGIDPKKLGLENNSINAKGIATFC